MQHFGWTRTFFETFSMAIQLSRCKIRGNGAPKSLDDPVRLENTLYSIPNHRKTISCLHVCVRGFEKEKNI